MFVLVPARVGKLLQTAHFLTCKEIYPLTTQQIPAAGQIFEGFSWEVSSTSIGYLCVAGDDSLRATGNSSLPPMGNARGFQACRLMESRSSDEPARVVSSRI